MAKTKVIKKKEHIEVHGLSPEQKADLVRLGVPMTTMVTGALILPYNLNAGIAMALGGTAGAGILGGVLRDKIVGMFHRHHAKKKLKKVM